MTYRLVTALLLACSLGAPASAQVDDAFADLVDEIDLLRNLAQVERRAIVADNLFLDAAERDAFWSLYEEYRGDIREVQGQLLILVRDFATNYETMTDEEAGRLLRNWFTYQEDLLDVRRRYVRRFEAILPQLKVARFFQIENKLDAISNLEHADEIPLVH